MKASAVADRLAAAEAEVELSRQRLQDTHENVVEPLRRAAAQNSFAELIAASLRQAERGGEVSQDQAILLAFKVVEVASVAAIAVFIACYSRWASWMRNPIGRTIVFKDVAIVLVLIPSILSIFVDFNRLTSHIAAWFDVGSFALVPVIMCWRTWVFWKIHRDGKKTDTSTGDG